jgi:Fe-S-cluster-containing dehydrogenase component/formate-dependent nitrite reductase membrane component NrfD
MPTFGFLIDNRKCIGCHACTVACKSEHQVPIGVDRTWVKYIEKGNFPHNRRYFTVMRCNHCDWAPCVTICPVTALYRRDDGVVDFNSDRCIGCKSCLQACPYDALYIDPDSQTAAKCNFCAHRLDQGLQPSCVVVCPEQAIVAGDLDDPTSEIARLLDRHPTQVRKPEKGTRPKLFYLEGEAAALVPVQTAAQGRSMWSRGAYVATDGRTIEPGAAAPSDASESVSPQRMELPLAAAPSPRGAYAPRSEPRRVYDVRPRAPAWGAEVVAYTWTKSIATGAFLAVAAAELLIGVPLGTGLALALGLVALVFLGLTAGLLVADLKQPRRFLSVLLRPQWRSWLVRGAYLLTGYGVVLTLWLIALLTGATTLASVLLWPGAILAVCSAVYTAFLFAQAKGRDFWQNPLLAIHLLAHALLAGSAVWLLLDVFLRGGGNRVPWFVPVGTLVFSLVALLAELLTTPATTDAHLALQWIIGRPNGLWFWGGGIGVGHVLPLLLLATGSGAAAVLAGLLALGGLLIIEWLWVQAPQQVPLS